MKPSKFLFFLYCLFSLSSVLMAQDGFAPEALYGPELGEMHRNEDGDRTARATSKRVELSGSPVVEVRDLQPVISKEPRSSMEDVVKGLSEWATTPSNSPDGRPLPVAGTWSVEAVIPPSASVEMIKNGHHVMIGFLDTTSRGYALLRSANASESAKEKTREQVRVAIEEYYRPGLEFARDHKLPIYFRGWNWAAEPVKYEKAIARQSESELKESSVMSIGGEPVRGERTDPLGPVKAWEDYGRFWFGNEVIRIAQEIYPDPPMVIFLNNNEAGEVKDLAEFMAGDRFLAKFGKGPHDEVTVGKILVDSYKERYEAMSAAARETLVAPGWKKNVRFVSYNAFWGHSYVGTRGGPLPGPGYTDADGWKRWDKYDGDMPELYDNDWQPGKKDNQPYGMQMEANNYAALQPWIFERKPEFLYGHIYWDGASISSMFRGRRAVSAPFYYATSGQRWDFDRYQGWVQFTLWTSRPRLAWEFRGGSPMDAWYRGTWMALVDSVDRPWNNELLSEFWRKGELVPNPNDESIQNVIREDHPQWLLDLNRWFVLTNTANPPRDTWNPYSRLNVFSQALVIGEEPNRRWLITAHAPNGVVADSVSILPGVADLRLPFVSRAGTFYLFDEKEQSLRLLLETGKPEASIWFADQIGSGAPNDNHFTTGEEIAFVAAVSPGPKGGVIAQSSWDFGDGKRLEQKSPEAVKYSYSEPGVYLVRFETVSGDGTEISDQIAVVIGERPAEALVYDLPLDQVLAWEGPWAAIGEDREEIASYQHVPNKGSGPSPIVSGAAIVEDSERGKVLEFAGDEHGGLWMQRSGRTTQTGEKGAANRTVAFWFKADDVNKRQVLYSSGIPQVGSNIYLDGGKLFAGAWAAVDGVSAPNYFPIYGRAWEGDWIEAGPIESGKWYHVRWALQDGGDKVLPDRQSLFLDGKLVGKAPGASIPMEYMPPRLARSSDLNNPSDYLTRFHDHAQPVDAPEAKKKPPPPPAQEVFQGRMSEFLFSNDALLPE